MSSRYYRPWSAPLAPQEESRPAITHQHHAVLPSSTVWVGRYPILPPVGHNVWQQHYSPPMLAAGAPVLYQIMPYPLSLQVFPSFVPTMAGMGTMQPYMYQGGVHLLPNQDDAAHQRSITHYITELRLSPKLLSQVCEEVVENALSVLIREVVNSCIDDIVTSYLRKANLLASSEKGEARLREGETKQRRRTPHRSVRSAMERRHTVKEEEVKGVCESLLDDMMFEQLLEMVYNRGGHVTRTATVLLNELLFEELMKMNWYTRNTD